MPTRRTSKALVWVAMLLSAASTILMVQGFTLAALAVVPVCIALGVVATRKLPCPSCGHVMRSLGYDLPHCPECGAPYHEG